MITPKLRPAGAVACARGDPKGTLRNEKRARPHQPTAIAGAAIPRTSQRKIASLRAKGAPPRPPLLFGGGIVTIVMAFDQSAAGKGVGGACRIPGAELVASLTRSFEFRTPSEMSGSAQTMV